MVKFESPGLFYWHYERNGNNSKSCTLDDIDNLKERLIAAGYYVKKYKNGAIVVKTPDEVEAARQQRLKAQHKEAAKYTKLGAAIPIPMAQAFAAACRKLGITQSDALACAINTVIKQAEQTPTDKNNPG